MFKSKFVVVDKIYSDTKCCAGESGPMVARSRHMTVTSFCLIRVLMGWGRASVRISVGRRRSPNDMEALPPSLEKADSKRDLKKKHRQNNGGQGHLKGGSLK